MRFLSGIGRAYRTRGRSKPFEPVGHKDVLFVFDEPGAWTRYRCDHQGEQLSFLGMSSDIVQSSRLDLAAAVDHFDTFVLNRVEWSDEIAVFADRARSQDRTVIFDTDDLLFEPTFDQHFAFYDDRGEDERRAWSEKLARYQATLRASDGAIVTTEPLQQHARRYSERVEVVYNAVSEEMVRLADKSLARRRTDGEVRIAYLSGTRTHNRDFLEAADAVLWALEEYPDARFLAVGKLDLDARFDRFGPQVERIPIQPWEMLPKLLARIDVNLAPLERDNPFAACKSCVKYLEAGLLGVPTIASAQPDFVRVIEPGRNGLLADSPPEWQEALRQLIESAVLRDEIGTAAHADVRRHHTTKTRARLLAEVLNALSRV
jgi:glycosyltransferase involved in cell wall biosynthesis